MLTDRENTFASRLPVTADGYVGDVILVSYLNKQANLEMYVQVEADFDALTSADFQFRSSAASTMSSPATLASSGPVVLATLNNDNGYRYTASLSNLPKGHNYVALYVDVTVVGTITTGLITGGIVEIIATNSSDYPTHRVDY